MKYKGIIFDLDGVICSTDEYHYQAWKAIADQLGMPFDRETNNRLRGVSRMQSLEIILEKSSIVYSEKEKLVLAEQKNEIYRSYLSLMSEADLSEEVKQTLVHLKDKKLKLAIGSSSKNTRYILERIGLNGFFDAVADGNSISHSKPNPEVFLLAANMIGMKPQECIVVEDAQSGIKAAIAGGFPCAAIGNAKYDESATWHLESFSDLLTIVER